jgi:hypothetical protein
MVRSCDGFSLRANDPQLGPTKGFVELLGSASAEAEVHRIF